MGTYNIRLGSQIAFDEQQEADIIKAIEAMNASHKSGQFLSNLIRIAFDCPEIMDKNNGKYEKGAIIRAIENTGISFNREAFMKQITKRVDDLQKKVDSMYNIVLKTYILAQMGKQLGLEEKAGNEVLAQFIVEKQLKELQDILGISLTSSVYASNRKQDIEKIANDALEFIIESYSDVLNELKAIVEVANQPITVAPQQVATATPQITKTVEQPITQPATKEQPTDKEQQQAVTDDTEDEIIDFGDADMSALDNFFGA